MQTKDSSARTGPRTGGFDRKPYQDKIDVIDKDIAVLKEKAATLSKAINEKSGGSEEFRTKLEGLRATDLDLQKKQAALEGNRGKLMDDLESKKKADKDFQGELKAMIKSIGFESEEQVDAEIAQINHRIHTESLDVKEERVLIARITELNRLKPKIQHCKRLKNERYSFKPETGGQVETANTTLTNVNSSINEIRTARNHIRREIRALSEQRKKALEVAGPIFDDREKVRAQIKTKLGEVKALKDEMYGKLKQQYEAAQKNKEERAARITAEKNAKAADAKVRELEDEFDEEAKLPMHKEVDAAASLLRHYSELLAGMTASAQRSESSTETVASAPAIEGTDLLPSKKAKQDKFYFAPTSRKAIAAASGASQAASSNVTAESSLKLDLETIGQFALIKVRAPATGKDIAGTVEQLKHRLETLKKEQSKLAGERESSKSDRVKALEDARKAAEAAKEGLSKYEGKRAPAVAVTAQ